MKDWLRTFYKAFQLVWASLVLVVTAFAGVFQITFAIIYGILSVIVKTLIVTMAVKTLK